MVPPNGPVAGREPWTPWRLLLLILIPAVIGLAQARLLHSYLNRGDVHTVRVERQTFGPLKLRLKLPGTHAGIPEPLFSIGKPGNASLVFIRLLKGSRAKVGIEFWGRELSEGDDFPLPAADAEIEVTCYLPALFPNRGNAIWGATPQDRKDRLSGEYRILVDGIERLKGSTSYQEPEDSPLYIGANPIGGSFVSDRFTGSFLAVQRSP